MAKDFFGTLGETLTKTARELSGRAEEVYETQRLRNKISVGKEDECPDGTDRHRLFQADERRTDDLAASVQ